MKKLSTLYKKDPNDLGRVIDEIRPENKWVFETGIPTRKFDGTACAIIDGKLYKRYDAKKRKGKWKPVPDGAIECQKADEQTGHWPHWVPCNRDDPQDQYHFEGFDKLKEKIDGTYELIGPKVQGNPENKDEHILAKHGNEKLDIDDYSFSGIKNFLSEKDIEGIVFHEITGKRMCKIRKSDFGIKR